MADRKFNQKRDDANSARNRGSEQRANVPSLGLGRGNPTFGSRSNNQGGMSPAGFQSQAPDGGRQRSAITNASFIQYPELDEAPYYRYRQYKVTPEQIKMTGGRMSPGKLTNFSPESLNVNPPGTAAKAARARGDVNDTMHRIAGYGNDDNPKRPETRPGSKTSETTSPRAQSYFDASSRELKNARVYGQALKDLDIGSMSPDERKIKGRYGREARAVESTGRGHAATYMNDYMAKKTADMRSRVNQPGGEQIGNRNHVAETKTPAKNGSTGRTGKIVATGALLAAAAGADRLMSGADKAISRPTKTEQMKSDAADMGPVKGRVLTRKTYEAAGGTNKQPTKIVPYEGQGKMSKALGVSNVKAGQNR
jgi:hypothetical protein